jgi:hypothetical protein
VDDIEVYSKRLDALVSTVRQLQQAEAQISKPDHRIPSAPMSTRQRRVNDRLSGVGRYRAELYLVHLMPAS